MATHVEPVPGFDVLRLRAGNPGPLTLSGTNTWIAGRDPAWVVDPGPALDEHLDATAAAVAERGGAGGIAVTHDHGDHAAAVVPLRERLGGVPVAAAALPCADVRLRDGDRFGELTAIAIPGHSEDHLAFVWRGACFSGDAILGEGSVFVSGRLGEYLVALRRLRGMDLEVILPGHGPPVLDPAGRIDDYVAHRMDRERRLVAALASGLRRRSELLEAVWDDVPPLLRAAAAVTLRAHLAKLEEEGRLPDDVERG